MAITKQIDGGGNVIRIRLTKKLAAVLNGIDVSTLRVGDILELPAAAAQMMIKEGWAELVTADAGGHLIHGRSATRLAH